MLFVHYHAHQRLRANTSGKIKRSSGCYYPRRYRLQLFRTATAGCSCTPRNLNRNRFWEKRFRWHNPSLGRCDRDGGEQTTSLDKTESPSKVFIRGVSSQKWPSNQITMFEKTHQSAWFDAVTTPLTRSECILAYKFLCTERVLRDFRWFIRHLSSMVRSAGLNKSSYLQVPCSISAKSTSTQIHMDSSK